MLTTLDVVIFLKSNEDFPAIATRVFAALHSQAERGTTEDTQAPYYRAAGLGFEALLFENAGDELDPEFEAYPYALNLTSQYSDVDLDAFELDEPLSEYYARLLAFDLDIETATEILVETGEDAEILEIRAYRRNPQYRADQGPTARKVNLVEQRRVIEPFDEEELPVEDEE